jgi:hypothetical protein
MFGAACNHMFLSKVRDKCNDQRLRGIHARLWRWIGFWVAATMLLFSGAWVCDIFHLRPRPVLISLGSISLVVTLGLGILFSVVNAIAITIYPKPGRRLEIIGAWIFNGVLIALLGLFGLVILASLF